MAEDSQQNYENNLSREMFAVYTGGGANDPEHKNENGDLTAKVAQFEESGTEGSFSEKHPDDFVTVTKPNQEIQIPKQQFEEQAPSINEHLKEIDRLNNELQQLSKQDLQTRLQQFSEMITSLKNESASLQTKNEDLQRECMDWKDDTFKKIQECIALQQQLHQKEDEIKSLNKIVLLGNEDIQERSRHLETANANTEQFSHEIQRLKGLYEQEQKDKHTLIQKIQVRLKEEEQKQNNLEMQLTVSQRKVMECEKNIWQLQIEKRDLTLRLSKLAGANLTYNNPNIADLSDANRPTKLAEEFSELYDNEWTDAFEALSSEDERGKTQIMLEILKKANQICSETFQDHTNAVKSSLITLNVRNIQGEDAAAETLKQPQTDISEEIYSRTENDRVRQEIKERVHAVPYKTLTAPFEKLTKEQMKTVSDIKKIFELELAEPFQKESVQLIVKSLPEDLRDEETVLSYIQKCLKLCWSMCRHEPPVIIHFIEPRSDTPFDTNIYKHYTKTGKCVDYVVWPALYLHEGGPMLSKGVAQGRM